MELNITRPFGAAGMIDYSASAAEIVQDAGAVTWKAACDDSAEYMMLDTEEKRVAFREHVAGFGAWEPEEVTRWSDAELNALLLQMIAGDVREAKLDRDSDSRDWKRYQRRAQTASALADSTVRLRQILKSSTRSFITSETEAPAAMKYLRLSHNLTGADLIEHNVWQAYDKIHSYDRSWY